MYQALAHCQDSKAQDGGGEEPARPYPFAEEVGRNFEQNVRNEEDGERNVQIEAVHIQVG